MMVAGLFVGTLVIHGVNLRADCKKLQAQQTELKAQKKELQKQIKGLGNININAIEEYKEVGERYEFLKGQYDDIKEAEAKLGKGWYQQ